MKKILTSGILFLTISYQILAQTPWQNYKDNLKKKSDAGDIEAMGMLGVSLFSEELPSPTHSSVRSQAESLLEKSAQMGSVTAKDVYNRFVLQNDEPLDEGEMRDLADKGNEVAQFLYAGHLKNQNNGILTEEIKNYYDKSAANNFSPAYLQHGLCVKNGDDRLNLLKLASDQGLMIAKMLYYYNQSKLSGNKSDWSQAVETSKRLANQGFCPAIDFIISYYNTGDKDLSVTPDVAKVNYFIVKKYTSELFAKPAKERYFCLPPVVWWL